MNNLLQIRGRLTRRQLTVLSLAGVVLTVVVWYIVAHSLGERRPIYESAFPDGMTLSDLTATQIDSINRVDSLAALASTEYDVVYPVLPPPEDVIAAIPVMLERDDLLTNTWKSVWLNLRGYVIAIVIALPLAFLIGLIPLVRGLVVKQVDTLRYLPLTALTGLFLMWYGIGDTMKIYFLAFGIVVYLLPVVVQRIDEVEDVYLKTVFTLGATGWQTLWTVYIPSVLSRVWDDIRVLTAISWTYIIIAELLNNRGGLGAMIYYGAQRLGRVDKVFALLGIIILIGFLQDRIFRYLDRVLFPHKHVKQILPATRQGYDIIRIGLLVLAVGVGLAGYYGIVNLFAIIALLVGVLFIAYGEYMRWRSLRDNHGLAEG